MTRDSARFWPVFVVFLAGLLNPILGLTSALIALMWMRASGRLQVLLWALALVWLIAAMFIIPVGASGASAGS